MIMYSYCTSMKRRASIQAEPFNYFELLKIQFFVRRRCSQMTSRQRDLVGYHELVMVCDDDGVRVMWIIL